MIEVEVVKILVDAGATHASAVRAARVICHGGTIHDARAEIELAAEPARFDMQLLLRELNRQREHAEARIAR